MTKVKNTFFDALYFLLDGMVRLSFQDYEPLQDPMKTKMLVYLGGGNVPLPDVHRIETRTLLTISNFGHLKSDALPAMLRAFETSFGVVTDEDRRTLAEVEDQLDKILFDDFIRRKAIALQRTIQRGITAGIDWYRASKPTGALRPPAALRCETLTDSLGCGSSSNRPTEVGSYMYEVLLAMVEVHAEISRVSKPLLGRTLSTLLEETARVALDCFRQVERFGMGGMLSVGRL